MNKGIPKVAWNVQEPELALARSVPNSDTDCFVKKLFIAIGRLTTFLTLESCTVDRAGPYLGIYLNAETRDQSPKSSS
jgi:hypothetical protein